MDGSIAEIAVHMDSLSETIDGTASSVVQMTGAVREIARNAEHLNDRTGSTKSALEQLGVSVKEVEENAEKSHDLSDQTAEQAQLGARSVQQTVEGMKQIQTSFQGLERIISDLARKSESIGEVVKVIEGVVEQTNLLALNAAIISSQAGEHGRAFAVVADEVRQLAERTAGSTREISGLIESVQEGVRSAVSSMAHGNERVSNGVALSRQAGQILRVIGESARTSSQRIHEIVDTTARQASQIGQVELAMRELETIAQQLNRGTHEQDNASAEITRSVERMRELGQRAKRSTQEQSRESTLITQSVETVATRIKQILEATTDQSKQGSQILEALQVFRDVTAQSNARGHVLRESLDELSERSEVLAQQINRFTV
jgi:methyl-accepting chemotaxis protein